MPERRGVTIARRQARRLLGHRYHNAEWVWRSILRRVSPRERRRASVRAAFVRAHGLSVQGGPFAGTTYVTEAVNLVANLVPRLLGAYESELHAVLQRVIEAGYETVVDIGAADGYYTIGLARALPDSEIVAFERNPRLRHLLTLRASANGVADRIRLEAECGSDVLSALPGAKPFLKVDCDGCEIELLRPEKVPILRRAAILVEMHDHLEPGATDTVLARFAATHTVELVASRNRDPAEHPELRALAEHDARVAVWEFRPGPMQWAFLVPRAGG